MSDWQPIETAPKDCSDILGWAEGWSQVEMIYWDNINDSLAAPHWANSANGAWTDTPPTHWMPLPPTPSIEKNT